MEYWFNLMSGISIPSWPVGSSSPCVEVVKQLVRKAGFSREVVEVFTSGLRVSKAAFCRGKWSRFLHWCCGWKISPCKVTIPQITKFFLYLQSKLKLFVHAVEGYCAALNHVFSLTGLDLSASHVISRMFHSFEKTCPPREVKLPVWNLPLVLQSLTCLC